MSAALLKIIALISMLIDHVAAMLQLAPETSINYEYLNFARSIGRLALPIFAYFVVEGFMKTSNLKKYIGRMHLFAIIAQIPFFLAFSFRDLIKFYYDDAAKLAYDFTLLPLVLIPVIIYWYFIAKRDRDINLLWVLIAYLIIPIGFRSYDLYNYFGDLNIFYELGAGLILLSLISRLNAFKYNSIGENIAAIIGFIIIFYLMSKRANYSYMAIALIVFLFSARKIRILQSTIIAIWGLLQYSWSPINVLFVVISAILIYFYNGKLGPKLKYLFYVFYPAHLTLIAIINIFILYRQFFNS